MVFESYTDLQTYIDEYIQPELDRYTSIPPQNLSYIQRREYDKLIEKKSLWTAFIWYSNNEGNIRGLLDRLPESKDKDYLLKLYTTYNTTAYKNKRPSAFEDLIPGLNAPYKKND